MTTNLKELKPARIISPGEIISDELVARDWTQEDLADILGVSIQTVNKLIKNKTSITAEMSVALGAAFNQSPEFWQNLDARYRSLKFADKEKEVLQKAAIYEKIPVNEMAKRGWIDKTNLLPSLLQFFKCDSWDAILKVSLSNLVFRKSEIYENRFDPNAATCWFQMAKNMAEKMDAVPYNATKLEQLSKELHTYTIRPNGIALFLEALKTCGVKFFILSHLPKTYIDGAAFFSGDSPVIVYTARFKRLDNFWFVIAHEIGHILHHLTPKMWYIIDHEALENTQMEKEANQEAQLMLRHDAIYEALDNRFDYLPSQQITTVATQLGLHPCIVVGALSRVKDQYYKRLHEFNEDLIAQIPPHYLIEQNL